MKRVLPILLILCVMFTTVFPVSAYAADTETTLGFSDSGGEPTGEPATPTSAAEETPETVPEETPGATLPEDTPDAAPTDLPEGGDPGQPEETPPADTTDGIPGAVCETPGISPLSEFTGEENEFFTRIRLTVTDRNGNPLSGAVYGLYDMNGLLVETLTTDAFGVAVSGDHPVNTNYYLEEITPPTGYAPNPERRDIILTEVCAPSLVGVNVEYDSIAGRIKVIKTDEYQNPLSGAGFYIYRSDTWELVDTIITGEDGTATTIDLPYGWYELYEYLVPQGFEGGGYYMAGIEEDGQLAEVYVTNFKSRAYVSVYKTASDGRVIPGAVFSIYTLDGVWVEDITTNSSGYAYSGAIELGEYYLVEKSVPEIYRLEDTPHYFTLSNPWQTVTLDIVNERAGDPGRVRVTKTDEKGNPLSDVMFGLYRAWDGALLYNLTTGQDGIAESDPLIPDDYYLVELVGKDGYDMATGQIVFTVDGGGADVSVVVVNAKTCVFGKVKVIKTDDGGNPVAGVRFGLYCHKDNLIQELITGADGTVVSGVLNEGDYYLAELAGLPSHVPDGQRYSFSITENNAVVPVSVVNTRVAGAVKVIKTGENGEPLPGVVFGIYKDGALVRELTTGEDGTAESGTLYYGDYELLELSTVEGYELLAVPVPFSILEYGALIEIPVTNPLIYGGVRIFKTDRYIQPLSGETDSASGNPLSGAVFGLYNSQDQLIAELITGADGIAEITGLVMGDYYLREHTAPEGFAPIDYDIPFSITMQGEVFEITIPNIPGSGTLQLLKFGEEQEPLAGVVFEVFRASDDEMVGEMTTDENGLAEITLPLGGYYLFETQTAEGYRLPEGSFSFELAEHGAVVALPIQNQRVPEEPEPVKCMLRLVKLAEDTQAPLPGAVFGLYDAATEERIAVLTTNENGAAAYELPEGAFYLLEQVAPEGFILSDDRIDFTLWNGEAKEITVTNAPIPDEPDPPATGFVKIVKQAEGTGTKLPGAVFDVHDAATGLLIATLTTGEDGTAVNELPEGGYYLLETQAPTGYQLKTGHTGFSVIAGETAEVTVYNTPIPPAPTTGFIKVTKKAEGTDALLSGAVFGVYEAGTDIRAAEIVTGADGTATTGELPAGNYYLLERKAPAGFELSTDKVGVTVKAGGTAEVTVYNAKTPDSGGDTGRLRLIKEAEDTGERLSGAVFGIYRTSNDRKVAEITTDRNGVATYELDAGRYYLRELKAPAGFTTDSGEISFTITPGVTKTVTVTNRAEETDTGHVRVTKLMEGTGAKLSGAVFGIYRAESDRKVAEITTDRNGLATYELEAGRYYLLEQQAPTGMKLKTDKISFTVKAGETAEVTVYNTPKDSGDPDTGNLYLVKKAEGTGARLPGAVFGVYRASDNAKVTEITTDSAGEAVCELAPNSYYLREIKAPTGFLLETASIPFTVKTGAVVRVEVTNMRDEGAGSVRLIKRGQDGEAVTGAVFGIYKASDNAKVAEITSGSDGTAVANLAPGAYYLLEQSVPSAYALNTEKHSFSVSSGRTVEVRVVNQRAGTPPSGGIEIPKTGEPFPYGSYALSALFLGIAALCGVMLVQRRGRRPKKA